NLNDLSIAKEDFKIKLAKQQKAALIPTPHTSNTSSQDLPAIHTDCSPVNVDTPSTDTTASTETINSPMVGTFYRCSSPDSPAYVNVGNTVKKGQTLAIIEAMKIMNEIEAEFDCIIKEIIPNDAQPVEYNSPLFVVEKL
ncbi:MAG: acetyl-CoA carboxylase biotin carboxyl carrier protein, partial [Helicobacter sp.]|nr:acetyl-CoA carboxylase biotin carboxyl carrier protein [Helicobacter sp.]